MSCLSIRGKESVPADLAGALRAFLGAESGQHAASLALLQSLRDNVTMLTSNDSSPRAREILQLYRAYLPSIKMRLPESAFEPARLTFAWSDTLLPTSPSRPAIGKPSYDYENACVFFNEIALVSRVAENRFQLFRAAGDDAAGHDAQKHFRAAAGMVVFLRDHIMSRQVGAIPADLRLEGGLVFFEKIFQAQAHYIIQELARRKAVPNYLECHQFAKAAASFFRESAAVIGNGPPADAQEINRAWPWKSHCLAHVAFLDAISFELMADHHEMLHQKNEAGNHIGTQIAWLTAATKACAKCREVVRPIIASGEIVMSVDDKAAALIRKVETRLAVVDRDNLEIYRQPVPEATELLAYDPKPLRVIEWVEPKLSDLLGGARSILDDIFPASLKPAMAYLDDELKRSRNDALERCTSMTRSARAVLAELGLPALVNATLASSGERVPESLWSRIAAVQAGGGAASIDRLLAAKSAKAAQANRLLDAINTALRNEAVEDARGRGKFAALWTLPPFEEAFETELRCVKEYSANMVGAQAMDAALDERISVARPGALQVLSESRTALDARVPPAPTVSTAAQNSPGLASAAAAIREVEAELQRVLEERTRLPDMLGARFDRAALIDSLSAEKPDKHQDIVDCALRNELKGSSSPGGSNPGRRAIDANLDAQLPLLARLRASVSHFLEVRGADHATAEHDAAVAALANALEEHDTIRSDIMMGVEFWTQLCDEFARLDSTLKGSIAARAMAARDFHRSTPLTSAGGPAALFAAAPSAPLPTFSPPSTAPTTLPLLNFPPPTIPPPPSHLNTPPSPPPRRPQPPPQRSPPSASENEELLVNMGFPRDKVKHALALHNGVLENALNQLTNS